MNIQGDEQGYGRVGKGLITLKEQERQLKLLELGIVQKRVFFGKNITANTACG